MCTVTYMPLPHEGFIITSTRDERILRSPALPPAQYTVHGKKLYYPRDQEALGTWIASGEAVDTLCLLNGGFKLHEPDPPYRKSRGMVLLDYYSRNALAWYRDEYDFSGIEPFTLLVLGSPRLDELRWDGKEIHHRTLPADRPGIWSSVTLYTPDVIRKRRDWFREWLGTDPVINTSSCVEFHKTAGTGDLQNDILMKRENIIRSVSITSIIRGPDRHEFYYEDMVEASRFTCPVV
jgi:hypothetical protein